MSTSYKTTGTIIAIDETKQISDRFRKREFVLEIADGKYPQTVQFQCTGDRCDLLDEYREGDELTVDFNLRGRAWTKPGTSETRYFNTLEAWKIEGQASGKQSRGGQHEQSPQSYSGGGASPDDDIPFASCDLGHEPSPIARVLNRKEV